MCLLLYTLCQCCEHRITYLDESERCGNIPVPSDAVQDPEDMRMCPFLEEVCDGYDDYRCMDCSEGWMRYDVDDM